MLSMLGANSASRKNLGRILVAKKVITPETLQRAGEDGCDGDDKLFGYLLENRLADERQILVAVGQVLGFPAYSAADYHPSPELAQVIPADFSYKYHVVPVERSEGELYVAVLGIPLKGVLLRLESTVEEEVMPLLCTRAEFEALQRVVYGRSTALSGMVDELAADAVGDDDVQYVEKNEEENITANEDVDEAPVIRLVNTILAEGVRLGASDVHISPEKTEIRVRYRRDGLLRNATRIPPTYAAAFASRVKVMGRMDISVTRVPQDGRFTIIVDGRDINVRVSTLPTVYGENIVMRLLDVSNRRIEELPSLGMNEEDYAIVKDAARKPNGLILLTGPTGSGKSTSLYSILKLVARPDINVITLEDPVEYRMDGIRQAELNRRAGMTFASGLRAILRQDPDVVMVGEIRDSETAAIAVQAALTGHLVLSTLHTNDAVSAVHRLEDLGIERFLISSTLLLSIAQRLVRMVCPDCRETYHPDPGMLRKLGLPEEGVYWRGKGCPHCGGTGYTGRMGIFEFFEVDDDAAEAISGGVTLQQLWRQSQQRGSHSMSDDVRRKILDGRTTVEEATRVMLV